MLKMSKRGQKGIALLLLVCVLFMFFAVPAQALASEILIASGVLLAFISATGIVMNITGDSADTLCQHLYDGFMSYCHQVGKNINFAKMVVKNGVLQLNKNDASLLQDYTNSIQTVSNVATKTVNVNGTDISLPVVSVSDYLNGNVHPTIFYDLGSEITINGKKVVISYSRQQFSATINGSNYSPYSQSSRTDNISYILNGKYALIYLDGNTVQPYLGGGIAAYVSTSWNEFPNGLRKAGTLYYFTQVDIKDGSYSIDTENRKDISDISDGQALNLYGYGNDITSFAQNKIDTLQSGTLTTPSDVTKENMPISGSVTIDGDVTIAEAELPDIDGISWGDIPTIMTTVFPFSIPWDVKRGLEAVSCDPVPPVWMIDFPDIAGIEMETQIIIDLSTPFWTKVFGFLRWAEIILWCAGLASASSKLIWGSD